MAEIFDFYVADNRTIKFNPIEPILQEDNGVAVWRFRIPKVLNNIDMSGFAWWFVYINAAKQKYSEPLTLTADADDPDNYCIADYTIDYGISLTPGSFTFALEAINANGSGDIVEEWHTKTYSHSVIGTLQGNQAEYSETESDIISALMVQIQEKYNALVGGATPIPVASISAMTDTSKIYLLTTDNNWYCYNGSTWVSGGQYASGIVIDPTLTKSGQAADAKVVGDEIEGVKSDAENYKALQLSNVFDTNIALNSNEITVSGTGTYVLKNIYEKTVDVQGEKIGVSVDSVTGATAENVVMIRYYNSENTIIQQYAITASSLPHSHVYTAPVNSVKVAIILYPAQGTVLPTGTATYTGITIWNGAESFYKIRDDADYPRLDEIEEELEEGISNVEEHVNAIVLTNVVGEFKREVVTGTGTYVYRDLTPIKIQDKSQVYTVRVEKITGATADNAIWVDCVGNGELVQRYYIKKAGSLEQVIPVSIISQTDTINIKLYPRQNTEALPQEGAIYEGIVCYFGDEDPYKKINPEIDTDGENFVKSRNIATKFIDARINRVTGAVYIPGYYVSETTGGAMFGATREAIAVEPTTQYTITLRLSRSMACTIYEYQADKTFIGKITEDYSKLSNLGKLQYITFTTGASAGFVRLQITASSDTTFSEDIVEEFQIEEGEVPTMNVNSVVIDNKLIDAKTQYEKLVNSKVVPNDFIVPEHYIANNYLNNKINRINELCESCAANGDAFIFITDEHVTAGQTRAVTLNQGHSYSLIKRISENCRIPRLFDGGDNADGGSLDHTNNIRKAFNGKVYHITGNHEAFYGTSKNTLYYYMDMFNEDQVGNSAARYYYVDNKEKKIRYIVLAAFEGDAESNNESNGVLGSDSEQRTWLRNTALNVESGWDIIIFIHMMFYVSFTEERTLVKAPGVGLEAIIDEYDGAGKILAVIQGHTHVDRIASTEGGVPVIMTTCDKNTPVSLGEVDDLTFDRPTGTISEQAFDVVILDRANKTFHLVRIGAQAQNGVGDNMGSFVEERTVTYA